MIHNRCECGIRNRMLILSQMSQRLVDAVQGFSPIDTNKEPFSFLNSVSWRCQMMEQHLHHHPYHPLFLAPPNEQIFDAAIGESDTPLSTLVSREPAIATQSDEQQTLQKRRITTNLKIDSMWELSKSATREGIETLYFMNNQRKAIIARQLKAIPIFDLSLSRILTELNEGFDLTKMYFSSAVENLTRHGIDQLLNLEKNSGSNRTPARFSKEIKKILIDSFIRKSPYPSETEKERLSRLCKLDYKQVSVWFANKRMRTKIHTPTNFHDYSTGKTPISADSPTSNFASEFTSNHTSAVRSEQGSFSGSPFTISSVDSEREGSFSPDNSPSPYLMDDAISGVPKSSLDTSQAKFGHSLAGAYPSSCEQPLNRLRENWAVCDDILGSQSSGSHAIPSIRSSTKAEKVTRSMDTNSRIGDMTNTNLASRPATDKNMSTICPLSSGGCGKTVVANQHMTPVGKTSVIHRPGFPIDQDAPASLDTYSFKYEISQDEEKCETTRTPGTFIYQNSSA
ncbi:hypothetical protein K493DRAFT_297203 [Basidiobolus meristosporus CBS 931.73]|uniref:Homeobox domain-containing protein n=1 Tax=Basidiobolus meristosporus CBS 931.73 TaxID=1314790 RepID=A0A1Y1Z110_9FUNG|nr:hypothetical protein K493DRAFT_297203 [Basidiobolus meristosporus CBS 931.73]|eukprot:ORY03972.1 hypothetical protein K493DRAFT_297203 [Basidiobolus meristosporus CBS 931.73]